MTLLRETPNITCNWQRYNNQAQSKTSTCWHFAFGAMWS